MVEFSDKIDPNMGHDFSPAFHFPKKNRWGNFNVYSAKCKKCGVKPFTVSFKNNHAVLYRMQDEIGTCKFKDFSGYRSEIRIDSDLIIANYFQKNGKYFYQGELSSYKEIDSLSKKYASKGIIFWQTSNITPYIYRSDDGLILLTTDIFDPEFNDLNDPELIDCYPEWLLEEVKKYREMNLTFLGWIQGDVWRTEMQTEKSFQKNQTDPIETNSLKINLPEGNYKTWSFFDIDQESILVGTVKKVKDNNEIKK